MNGKLKKHLGFPWMIFALFFLFEPYFMLFDIFPDFIGYLAIYIAIANLSDLNDYVESARKKFKYAIYIGASRYLSILFLGFVGAQSASEGAMWRTILIFLISVADAIVASLAFKDLFDGLSYLGTFNGGVAVNEYRKHPRRADRAAALGKPYKVKHYSKNASSRATIFCFIFIIIKNAACMIPEFTTLITNQDYVYAPLIRIALATLTAVVGIAWLISILRYLVSVLCDKQFLKNLRDKYNNEIITRSSIFVCRNICFMLFFATAGFVLTPELYSDHYSILPDAIACIPMIIFSVMMLKHTKKAIMLTVSSAVSFVSSAVYWYFTMVYYDNFTTMSYLRNPEAELPYLRMYYSSIVASVLFAITCGICMLLIYYIVKDHTGKVGQSQAAINYNTYLHSKFQKLLVGGSILSILSSASTVLYVYTRPIVNPSSPWYLTGSVVIIFITDLIFAAYMAVLINSISDEIKKRYSYF